VSDAFFIAYLIGASFADSLIVQDVNGDEGMIFVRPQKTIELH
jgi:hypothetical protein